MTCRRYYVSGQVQGVFFRESARREADGLGITGHAVNLGDGRVEVLACGEEGALRAFEEWLWQGPRMAVVENVEKERAETQDAPARFSTR